ncbi:MAG: GGDEF domain-containing protein [Humidesulfovibrio sp.]|nr:GGDEF domain-containing protein [Humidesulfovibrio sp.]
MKLTDQSLSEQLRITPLEITRRKELFGITPGDTTTLIQAKEVVTENLDAIVEEFYANQVATPEVEGLIGDAETLARLKKHMARYLLSLFGGEYDDIYVLSRLRVGLVHNRIGVPPKLYVSSVRTLLDILRRYIAGPAAGGSLARGSKAEGQCRTCLPVLQVLEKVLLFDLSLVFDTYIQALVTQVERGKADLETYAKGLELEVAARTRQLEEQASRDPLTGLPNRRALFESLRREIAHAGRHGHPLTLAYMDLDGFKGVNDRFGHKEGDRVLLALAEALRASLRMEDLPARLGGDEFCVLLPAVDLAKAETVMRRLFATFDALLPGPGKRALPVTISVGLAALDLASNQAPEILAKQADEAMYQAKEINGHAVVAAKADRDDKKG